VSGELVLYTIPGSHACRATTLMLEHKGIPWRERVLMPGVQTATMRLRGFPKRTVPAIRADGERVQTNREIARFLDRLQPEPPLVGAGAEEQVADAEAFVDGILQPVSRRLVLAAGRRDLDLMANRGDAGRLGALLAPRRYGRRIAIAGAYRYFGIQRRVEVLDLAALPSVLDYTDSLVMAGVLNGAELNAADFQAAPCLALLDYRLDVRDLVRSRPSWALVERLLPDAG
jgi:glutathione S-transferase